MTVVDTGTPKRCTQVFFNIEFCYWSRPFSEVFFILGIGFYCRTRLMLLSLRATIHYSYCRPIDTVRRNYMTGNAALAK